MKNNFDRLFPLLLLMAANFSSCDLFKPAQDSKKEKVYKDEDLGEISGKKVYDPETGEWRTVHEVNEKVDTVKWKELTEENYPPITTDPSWSGGGTKPGNSGGGNKPDNNNSGGGSGKGYNVTIMLPFLAQRFDTANIDEDALWAIHFYAGAKLAYGDLEQDGVNLNIYVADTEASTGKVTNLLKSNELQKADMIIGPYKRDNVALAADFAKKNKKPLIVPYTAQMGMAENNPYYVQVNPSLKSHCEAITRHIRKQYKPEDVVLVTRSKDEERGRLKYFQDENALIEGGKPGKRFTEYVITDETGDFRKIDVTPFVREGKTTVFVVPSWSSETFVYSLMRQLMIKQSQGEEIVVYGMPQWINFEQIEYDYFEKLNVHISSASYMDDRDEKIRQFKRKFFDAYGAVPSEEAYLGYDVTLYFGKMLDQYGKNLTMKVDATPYDVLHGRFDFERVLLAPESHREDSKYYDQLENKFVHILAFKDFKFEPKD